LKKDNFLTSSREDLLISLSTLAVENSEKKRELKKILEVETNWQEFLKKETSLPLYYNLKKLSLKSFIPSQISDKLEKHLLINTGYNVIYLENLVQLIQRLKEQQIQVIILKGAALCETVYPHVGLRSFIDLDILIKKSDLRKVKKELKLLGYSLSHTFAEHHLIAFKRSNHSLPLEVHWDLVNKASPFQKYAFKLSIERFWQEAVPIRIGGTETLGLSPEHQLIYLSTHMLKEGYANKKWFLDLYYLIKFYKGKIDWEKLLRESKEFRVRRPLYYAFSYLNNFFQTKDTREELFSKEIVQNLAPKRATRLEKTIFARLLKNKSLNSFFYRLFLYLFTIEGLADKFKALFSLMIYIPQVSLFNLKEKIYSRLSS